MSETYVECLIKAKLIVVQMVGMKRRQNLHPFHLISGHTLALTLGQNLVNHQFLVQIQVLILQIGVQRHFCYTRMQTQKQLKYT